MTLRRLIWQGERYPRGYGMAWLDYQRNAAVCYPIPLNVVMRAVYLAWVWAMCPFGVRPFEHRCAALTLENERLRAIAGFDSPLPGGRDGGRG
jgi:hypothetical protein